MIEAYLALRERLEAGIRQALGYGASDVVFFGTLRKESMLAPPFTVAQLQEVDRTPEGGGRNVRVAFETLLECRYRKGIVSEADEEEFKVREASKVIQVFAPYSVNDTLPVATSPLREIAMAPRAPKFVPLPQSSDDNYIAFQLTLTCFVHVLQ